MSQSRIKSGLTAALRNAAQLYAVPTASLRMLPSFLIIGAERAGTTSLSRYLGAHPQVIPLTLNRKGCHYFDTNFDRGVRWYRSQFPSAAAVRSRMRRASTDRVITGEACPYYVFHPLVPERVHALLPDVRLVVMLRDPVSRAYSHYQHEVARGFEHLSFESALDAEPERLAGEEERLLREPSYYSFSHQHHSYVSRGLYLEQFLRWHAWFAPEQMLIVDSTEFFADTDRGFREVVTFLGLEERSLAVYPQLNARSYDRIAPETRERLLDRFAEPNRRLEEYLGRSFSWSTARARPTS